MHVFMHVCVSNIYATPFVGYENAHSRCLESRSPCCFQFCPILIAESPSRTIQRSVAAGVRTHEGMNTFAANRLIGVGGGRGGGGWGNKASVLRSNIDLLQIYGAQAKHMCLVACSIDFLCLCEDLAGHSNDIGSLKHVGIEDRSAGWGIGR